MAGNPPEHSRFKPGQSGNPAGRPKKAVQADVFRQLHYAEFIELLNKCMVMTKEEMKEFLGRPDATMFELVFGGLVVQATKDKQAREQLTDRLFGKVKDISENINVNIEQGAQEDGPVFLVELNQNGKFVRPRPTMLLPDKKGS